MSNLPRQRARRARLFLPAILAVLLGLWLTQVSRPGRRVKGCADGCAHPQEREPGPLRILSLNMLHGFPRFEHLAARLDRIAGEIQQHDADIVLLQEVPWTLRMGSAARLLAERAGFNHLYYRANGNRWAIIFEEGEAILSRYPLREAVAAELEPRAGRFEHRVVLGAVAVTPFGDLPVFVTHLTNGSPDANRGQAAGLQAFVSAHTAGPALVAGDFNATPDLPQILALSQGWVDLHSSPAPGVGNLTCCVSDLHSGPEEPLEKRIDYVFLVPSPEIHLVLTRPAFDRPTRVGSDWLWPSDHAGLFVSVELAAPSLPIEP